jgi:integrase/recombinase XerD
MQSNIIMAHKQEKFFEYLQLKKYTLETCTGVVKTITRFAQWAEEKNIPLLDVSYNDVMAYVAHCRSKRNAPRTLQIVVLHLRFYYAFLLSENDVQDNPCSNIEIKGVKRKMLYETFTPEELENLYRAYASLDISKSGIGSRITHKRNKVLLGLVIYQGLRTQELAELKVSDVKLQEGKIKIEGSLRTEGRELKLEAFQLYDMMDYINETRKLIMAISGKETNQLFTSLGGGENFSNITDKLLRALRKIDKRVKETKQLRGSVITNWLKVHNIRKVQYMAGHRYVSSTENYQANNMDDLKEDVNRYHPDL